MSKVAIALGSFILGACTMLFSVALLGSHTSTFAHSSAQLRAIGTGGEPTVPGITMHAEHFGLAGGLLQSIDGLDCKDCKFSDVTLEYSGGAFQLTNFPFSGPLRVNLKGAAANTVAFLNLVQAIAASQRPPEPKPNSPIIKTATIKETMTGDFASPYGLSSSAGPIAPN